MLFGIYSRKRYDNAGYCFFYLGQEGDIVSPVYLALFYGSVLVFASSTFYLLYLCRI